MSDNHVNPFGQDDSRFHPRTAGSESESESAPPATNDDAHTSNPFTRGAVPATPSGGPRLDQPASGRHAEPRAAETERIGDGSASANEFRTATQPASAGTARGLDDTQRLGAPAANGASSTAAASGHGSTRAPSSPHPNQSFNDQSHYGGPNSGTYRNGPASQQPQMYSPVSTGGAPSMTGTASAKQKSRPGWFALIVAALLAALLGGILGVGLTTMRWDQARPATLPEPSEGGTTDVVDSAAAAPDWEAVSAAAGPSVVAINVSSAGTGASAGSGVIIDADGHIMTNDHVISGASNVMVSLQDGRVFEASLVGNDEATDLAVIKIQNPPDNLTAATLGTSSELVVGEPVAAIGNPLGLSSTMTTGIISALDRPVSVASGSTASTPNQPVVTNAIQIDAAVNPGNSGGPVFDAQGRVIGIASSIATLGAGGQGGSIGLGFAIPIDLAKNIGSQLIENGVAEHAFLGVATIDGTAQFDGQLRIGADIKQVTPNTPASEAGLKEGDVIVQIDGKDVSSALSLTGFVRQYRSGDEVTLKFERNGELLETTVTLATRPDN